MPQYVTTPALPAPRGDTDGYVKTLFTSLMTEFFRHANAINANANLAVHTLANLPSGAVEGQMIYVADEAGGAVPAFFDGSDWRRVTDRAVVS
jgi:hypothetical protein